MERAAKSHSKCNICCKFDTDLSKWIGNASCEAKEFRKKLARAVAVHEQMHLSSRQVLDDAGLEAIANPRLKWTLIVDAATQRNFNLPKFRGRSPKAFAKLPYWEFKLMCVYAYGFGFVPFLVHNSQKGGPNLTWTVIWEVICDMRTHYGFYGEELHLQLDNTKADNKNYAMVAMAAWLVKSGRFKRVRVFFLMVGHTHVIIDQIFGAITTGTKGHELMVPEDLIENINATCSMNPQWKPKKVRWLKALFDFSSWVTLMEPYKFRSLFDGDVSDEYDSFQGEFDFLFYLEQRTEEVRLQYREHNTHSYRPSNSPGALTIKHVPLQAPDYASIKPKSQWGLLGGRKIEDTITVAMQFAKDSADVPEYKAWKIRMWLQHIKDVPHTALLLKPEYKFPFRHLEIPMYRIGFDGNATDRVEPQTEEEMSEEVEFKNWCCKHFNMRIDEMAIDPVVSSEQSAAQVAAKIKEFKLTVCGREPTTSKESAVMDGAFVLISAQGRHGVELAKVCALPRGVGVYSINAYYTVQIFVHSPNRTVSGLFGTWAPGTQHDPDNPRKHSQIRCKVTREQILVFNVDYISRKHIIGLSSLRALARVHREDEP